MAQAKNNTNRGLRTQSRLMVTAVSACFAASSYALPTDPNVVNGSASFAQAGNVLNVTNSNGAIINWNTFSIGASETTRFIQSSASSSVLNRVLSNDPSVILGTLTSNGRVFLINPNGIMVGAGAHIDVAGFVASTLNISNANFLANKLQFDATPGAGNVVNQGNITTPSGGSVYLVAPNVTNEGIITTPQGETILAAGQSVTLLDTGTPGVGVEITGAEGNATNLGTIVADAGRIGIAGVIVRNSGTLNASSVLNEGGRIFLKASQDAYVDGNGRIVTTGTKGGRVEVLGNRVAVMDNASIDASGTNGGGTVLVGGDYQGKNPNVQNSTITYFGPNATIKADATNNGNGGKVIVWADDTTRAYGSISARGGANGGNGGFVETSGHRYLDVIGARVTASAVHGSAGTWLLDPSDIHILSGGSSTPMVGSPAVFNPGGYTGNIYDTDINATLDSSTSLIIQTNGGTGATGVYGGIDAFGVNIHSTTNASLSLLAFGSAGNITIADSTINVGGNLTMVAGWDGANTSAPVPVLGNGTLSIRGENTSTSVHSVGAMTLKAGSDIKILGGYWGNYGTSVSVRSDSDMTLAAGRDINILGGYDSGDNAWVTVASVGNMSVTAGGTLTVAGGYYGYSNNSFAVLAAGGSQTINAINDVKVLGGGDSDGSGYYGGFATISSFGDQTITADNIYVIGGGDNCCGSGGVPSYDNFATIQHGYTDSGGVHHGSGGQTINITNGGTFLIQGGSGYGTGGTFYGDSVSVPGFGVSNNYASVWNDFGSQTVTFANGGSLEIIGGGAYGNGSSNNFAALESKGAQTIGSPTGRPDITILGGYGGSVFGTYSASNDASISADGAQTIYGNSLTMQGRGDSMTYGGAFIGGGPNIHIDIAGNVDLQGGYSSAFDGDNFGAPVAIGNKDSTNVTLNVGGYIDIQGGSGISSGVLIGSLHGTAPVSITAGGVDINSGYGGVVIGALKNAPSSFGPGNVFIDSSTGIGSNSFVDIYAQRDVNINGFVVAADQVYVDAGGYGNGGNIHLGGASAIGGYSVDLFASSVWNGSSYVKGNITQDSGGVIVATAAASCVGDCYNPTAVQISAGGYIDLAGAVVLSNGGRIRASANGGDLTIGNLLYLNPTAGGYAYLSSANGALNIGSSGSLNFTDGSGLSGYTGVTIDAIGDVSLDNSSCIHAGSSDPFYSGVTNPNANLTIRTSGDLTLDNGSYMEAGNDVFLTLRGANSVLSLNNNSAVISDVATGIPATTHIDFKARSSGGILIDGVSTTTTVYGGSGFFSVFDDSPDNNLDITYAPATNNAAGNAIDQVFNNLTKVTSDQTTTDDDKKKKGDDNSNEGEHNNEHHGNHTGQCT